MGLRDKARKIRDGKEKAGAPAPEKKSAPKEKKLAPPEQEPKSSGQKDSKPTPEKKPEPPPAEPKTEAKPEPENVTPEDLVELVPSEGKISLKDASAKLGITYKHGKGLSKELYNTGMVGVKLHFFGGRDLIATRKLIGLRDDREFMNRKKSELQKIDAERGIVRVWTIVDDILLLVREKRKITTHKVAEVLKLDEANIEKWAKMMPDLMKVEYPANVLSRPLIGIIKDEPPEDVEVMPEGRILESYEIEADNVPTHVSIFDSEKESMPLYVAQVPKPGEAASSILKTLADKLTDKITIGVDDISDPSKMLLLKDRFYKESSSLIGEHMPVSESDRNLLAGILLHMTYGLGNVELLMYDDWLEEIAINTSHVPLTVYHKKYGWSKTNLLLKDEKMVYNYAAQIGRKIGKGITNLDPILDAHLLTGDRVCASLFPISSLGNTITIRKFARQPWTLTHFISDEYHTLSKEIAAFLWLCFQYELNVIVGGGTASGKTSVLNCLLSLIQPTHRVITIEDTRELNLPKYLYWNWIPLTTREANPEGKGEISMLDLIVTSLRMRPDRIILGEIRRKREAEVLFEAMHTGHSVYATMHADTARNLKRRLLEPPIELPSAEVEALHLVIVQYRDRTTGKRKTFEVAEIIPGTEGKEFDLNYLYRWSPREQKFVKINDSVRIYEELNLHTGMSKEEIESDLKERGEILQWMLDKKISSLNGVGRVMDEYYKDKEKVLKIARSGGEL